MINIAILQGNPLFQLLPKMINGAKPEFKQELIEFMTH
jgi:hypothetical protein